MTVGDERQSLPEASNPIEDGSRTSKFNSSASKKSKKSKPTKATADWVDFHSKITIPLVIGLLTIGVTVAGIAYTSNADKNRDAQSEQADKDRKSREDQAEKNRQEQARIAQDSQEHQIMSDYLKQMTELILDKGLSSADSSDATRAVARAITLNATRQFDSADSGKRKGQLIKFLYEADLLGGCDPQSQQRDGCQKAIVELRGIKLDKAEIDSSLSLLGADLGGVELSKANLPKIFLNKANMDGATLVEANLTGAFLDTAQMQFSVLEGIILSKAQLSRANLLEADLKRANLAGANLTGANLQKADLRGANLTGANLEDANLQNALYNAVPAYDKDGKVEFVPTQFPQGFNPVKAGMLLEQCKLGKCERENQEDR